MQPEYTAVIPQWIIILTPIMSVILGVGGAWALMKYKVDTNTKRIDALEMEDKNTSREVSEMKTAISNMANDISWMRTYMEKKSA